MDEQKEHRVKTCEHFMQTCQINDENEDASFVGSYGVPTGKYGSYWHFGGAQCLHHKYYCT
jgi:hypothetical protein